MRRKDGGMRKMYVALGTLLIVGLYYIFYNPHFRRMGNVRNPLELRSDGSRQLQKLPPAAVPSSKLSKWQHLDWLPERDKATVLNSYQEHANTPQWEDGERILTCHSEEADKENLIGVDLVRRHVMRDHIRPVDSAKAAQKHFEEAVSLEPNCYTARLNLAILLCVVTKNPLEDYQRMGKILQGFPEDHTLYAKSLLWTAISLELQGIYEQESHDMYQKTFDAKPALALLYFGKEGGVYKKHKKLIAIFKDTRMKNEIGLKIQQDCLKKILMYYEFSKHFSGYNHVSKEQALTFHDNWFFLAKDMVPPYVVKVMQECYRQLISKGILKFDDKQSKRYYHYNSPPARFVAAVYVEFISRLWARPMKATYTYMGGYPGGSELKPHVDRKQCEITMSVSIDVNPDEETCPLGLRLEPKKLAKERSIGNSKRPTDPSQQTYVYPRPGDALVFRGRGVVHWRDRIPEGMNCTNLFFHYVLIDFEGKIE
eukprot:TRINITY_DN19431_c0_g2_i1.p1 TRINITY_DN19431_c0_g2~~TRINITY_DN19431_c0_g2_i1.p1  ORF type:complete len:501 (+),score=180.54 TRINITY_DN19431_c0_g2_i1:55-1503(+)